MLRNDTERDKIKDYVFAILPEVVSSEVIDEISQELSEVGPHRGRAGVRHAMRLAPVAGLVRSHQLMALACDLLGSATFPYRATLFEKTPATNWLIVWHQDTALPLQGRRNLPGWGPWSVKEGVTYAHAPVSALEQVLTLRVHFDDSTHGNGPLRVLPGTHGRGVLSDDEIHQLSTKITPVTCVVAKGGVVAMRPLLIHSSSKLQNDHSRRVLHIEYAASDSIASPLRLALA